MSLLYPLGLLGLVGIPVLIAIYILKNKYTEQTVASTYLWTLSEQFLKNKKPLPKLSGIISLILQIFIVIVISLAIANPVFILRGSAKEYCFILDASGSMTTMQDGVSRFDLGKQKIEALIGGATNGSTFTLVYAGETTRVVYEKLDDKERALMLLSKQVPSSVVAGCKNSLVFAQEYFDANPSVLTYLVTDRAYETENLELVNVAAATENSAVRSMTVELEPYKDEDGLPAVRLKAFGEVVSYTSDAELTLTMYVDGEKRAETELFVEAGKETEYAMTAADTAYASVEVRIEQADGIASDNSIVFYNAAEEHANRALLVGSGSIYLKSVIETMSSTTVETVSPDEYDPAEAVGYGLYVFDGFAPEVMPSDGSVWLFNQRSNVNGAGFSVQSDAIDLGKGGGELTYANSPATLYKKLTADLTGDKFYVGEYVRYGLYRSFTTVLSYDGYPLVFAGTNSDGNREIVFAFDVAQSDMALKGDFLILMKNFLSYSFPVILEQSLYDCGDKVTVNVLSGCKNMRIESPSGRTAYMETSSTISEYRLVEAGTYKLTMNVGGRDLTFFVYAAFPSAEADPSDPTEPMVLRGEAADDYADGRYDDLLILFIILAVLVMADWAVYCYEQYQLR